MQFQLSKHKSRTLNQEFQARINQYEMIQEKVIYFLIIFSNENLCAKVSKARYSDFKRLHQSLIQFTTQIDLQITLPQFPRRKLMGKTNQSVQSVQQRMIDLQSYFNQLLAIEDIYGYQLIQELLPDDKYEVNDLLDLIPEEFKDDVLELRNNSKREDSNEMLQLSKSLMEKFSYENKQPNLIRLASFHPQRYFFEIEDYQSQQDIIYYSIIVRDLEKHDRWKFKTRYRDLKKINHALKQEKLSKPLPEFPGRKFFGMTNMNPQLVEARKTNIIKYLNEIFSDFERQNNLICRYFIENSRRLSIRQGKSSLSSIKREIMDLGQLKTISKSNSKMLKTIKEQEEIQEIASI